MALRTTAHGGSVPTGGGAFATDLQGMDSAVQQMRHTCETMAGRVNKLFAYLEFELNAGTWQSEAARAFHRAKEQWGHQHLEMRAWLDSIASNTHGNRVGYQQMEQDNLDAVHSAARA